MEFLNDYGLFLAKALTVLLVLLTIISAIVAALRSARQQEQLPSRLQVRHLNEELRQASLALKSAMLPAKAIKRERKRLKLERKRRDNDGRRRLFVLDFHGDIRASATESLREEITALLTVAEAGDEVLLRLESGGGTIPAYGLAAAQLLRLRDRQIDLTVAVDRVAASGGYMMACVGNQILSAPFAILGSIGVIAQLPNFNRMLKRHDIDFEQFMAGEHKRTVTLFGENTEQGREKFQQEIERAHDLFKDFVGRHRPQLDVEAIATGEYWYGIQALEYKLSDRLQTSDDYLLKCSEELDIYLLSKGVRKPLLSRLLPGVDDALARLLGRA
ncbi:MAG: protease SohB [Wenzhouxiangella sp.]|nr:protease SohB [Wenzhouxiangella sp.]MCH8479794.1 protease SohB [Wenzhouxiangella sp.]TVR95646.1 MAG: protease SohB [Wenzhouxiangellaceae bacterium]